MRKLYFVNAADGELVYAENGTSDLEAFDVFFYDYLVVVLKCKVNC